MADIKYGEDIIKEMAEEFGRSEKEIAEIIKLNINYVHKLTKDPNVITIALPKLGVLHFNQKKAKSAYLHSSAYKKYIDIIDSQIDIVEDVYSENKNLVHKRTSFFSRIKKILYKDRKERMRTSKSEVFKKMELKQNKIKE